VPQLAQALRAAREAKGLTQVQLSQRSGVTLSFINELENCHRDTTTHTLLRLTRALGTTISDLFRDIR
jgi:transcriptional regulator with XRE-family HTH domain